MKNKFFRLAWPLFLMLFMPSMVWGEDPGSLDDIAYTLMGMTGDIQTFFQLISLVTGTILFMTGYIKLKKWRKKGHTSPVNRAIMMLIIGGLLIAMYFFPHQGPETIKPLPLN